jgi:hypothetical protein
MLTSVEGIYRDGRIELTEQPEKAVEGTRVIVTFLKSEEIDPESQGMNQTEADTLQAGSASSAKGWSNPEMSVYDDYNAARATTHRRSVIDILQELPGQQVFKTPQEVDRYLQEERNAWER